VNYLLDTNVCIALINGSSDPVRRRFDQALGAGSSFFVSSVAMFELWCGVFKGSRGTFNTNRLNDFVDGPITVIAFDEDDARASGSIRASLKLPGKPIGTYDVLIAGQALHRKLTLVTANVSEFSRVKNLSWQDWSS
jgi:tRNA(fMet)-specific endonuclease VapC